MSTTVRSARAAQSIRLAGPDYIVRATVPALIVRSTRRAPLAADEAEAYVDSGSQQNFFDTLDIHYDIVNNELPDFLGPGA